MIKLKKSSYKLTKQSLKDIVWKKKWEQNFIQLLRMLSSRSLMTINLIEEIFDNFL